jgi:RNA polymerase sigma factor (sigma-70 family)
VTNQGLAELVAKHSEIVRHFARRHAGERLLRIESEEDLAQGVCARALERGGGFDFRSDPEFRAWIFRVARGYLADRREHWSAKKRRPARLLRLTATGSDTRDPGAAREPATKRTGPSTFASRREQLTLALEALAMLLPRDRDLVTWHAEGVDRDTMAARLCVSRDAADRAKSRALERFRKAYVLISGSTETP